VKRLPVHVRGIALLSAGALGVHELRFLAACGDAQAACGSPGHAYLALAGPLAGMLLAVALGGLLGELLRPGRSGTARAPSFGARWAACAVALVAVYSVQELVEALATPGRAAGVAAVLGSGGWWALVFAVLVGAIVALLLRGAEAAVAWASARRRLRLPLTRPLVAVAPLSLPLVSPAAPRAGSLGARAPPAAPLA
jgi:hypothetical protein